MIGDTEILGEAQDLNKISGRVPQPLAKMIETGKRPPLSRILPDSCEKVGGFGDSHTVAASGVFPIGREEAFLEALNAHVNQASLFRDVVSS
jgi:hypothetical protein